MNEQKLAIEEEINELKALCEILRMACKTGFESSGDLPGSHRLYSKYCEILMHTNEKLLELGEK